jgi:hypothetical protein
MDMRGWGVKEIMDMSGWWWDGTEPYSIKPLSGKEEDTSAMGGVDAKAGPSGTMIDCRLPVEVRKEMALGNRPVTSYHEWKQFSPDSSR